jgi:hypothetical protein
MNPTAISYIFTMPSDGAAHGSWFTTERCEKRAHLATVLAMSKFLRATRAEQGLAKS